MTAFSTSWKGVEHELVKWRAVIFCKHRECLYPKQTLTTSIAGAVSLCSAL